MYMHCSPHMNSYCSTCTRTVPGTLAEAGSGGCCVLNWMTAFATSIWTMEQIALTTRPSGAGDGLGEMEEGEPFSYDILTELQLMMPIKWLNTSSVGQVQTCACSAACEPLLTPSGTAGCSTLHD